MTAAIKLVFAVLFAINSWPSMRTLWRTFRRTVVEIFSYATTLSWVQNGVLSNPAVRCPPAFLFTRSTMDPKVSHPHGLLIRSDSQPRRSCTWRRPFVETKTNRAISRARPSVQSRRDDALYTRSMISFFGIHLQLCILLAWLTWQMIER